MNAEFLPGVPVDHVLRRLAEAGGKEIESRKFASPESSAALAVNCFGWFIPRPAELPPLPGFADAGRPELVDVEFCARFPWSGGRHPWLDAVVQTSNMLIGVESKRFEPFRDRKSVSLSSAYDRDVWGSNMKRYQRVRDQLRSGELEFQFLDGAQLLKHAFGLVTAARRRKLTPALFYIYAEPVMRGDNAIDPEMIQSHRREAELFHSCIEGDEVRFSHASYRDWLGSWDQSIAALMDHRDLVLKRFEP